MRNVCALSGRGAWIRNVRQFTNPCAPTRDAQSTTIRPRAVALMTELRPDAAEVEGSSSTLSRGTKNAIRGATVQVWPAVCIIPTVELTPKEVDRYLAPSLPTKGERQRRRRLEAARKRLAEKSVEQPGPSGHVADT